MCSWNRFALLAGLAASVCWGQQGPPAHSCSNADFVGKYAFQSSGFDMRQSPPLPTTAAGSFEADGMGGFLAWNDWLTLAGAAGPVKRVIPNDLVAAAAAAGSRLEYEVLPNCQMRIFGTVLNAAGQPIELELLGGLSGAGRKAMLQAGSPVFIGAWTAESAEPNRFVARVQSLLNRVATRLSVRP